MRECIYCGKQLEKGELCDCAMSVSKRQANNAQGTTEEKKEKKREKKQRVKKPKMKRESMKFNNVFSQFLGLLKKFIISPVETVMNPGEMSKPVIFTFVILEGIIIGLSAFSVTTGAVRGPFGFIGNVMGFKGMAGYEIIKSWILAALSGAATGIIIYFAYSGIFYIVNRWIFKQLTPYWEFVKRFVFAPIPLAVIGAVGVILGMFSQITFVALLISGLVGTLLITYEILRSVWYSKSTTKTIYTMMICIFVFLLVFIRFISFV